MQLKSKMLGSVGMFAFFIALAVSSALVSASARVENANGIKEEKDIVETAVAAGDFTTLAKALNAAGLVETLKGPGPYTVFAPTDEAFGKLPPGVMDSLMKDPEKLKKVLLAHVVSGKVTAKDVTGMKSAKTLNGSSFSIKSADGKLKLGNANIVKTDITASNGVIHAIDTVLIPTE